MGGVRTGVTEATTDVFLEAAFFDPIRTARTGRRLKVASDARYRFERGVDPAFTPLGIELATAMILDLCGGEPSEVVTAGAVPDTARSYRFDPARITRLVGMDLPAPEQARILAALGFTLDGDRASPPSWRPDVQGDADLVEEVARIASLSRLEGRPLPRPAGVARPILTPAQRREGQARRRIAALGYNEAVTYSFIDAAAAALFGGGSDAVRLENPISSEMSHLRPDLLPGLLRAAARNQARGIRRPRPLRDRPGLPRRRARRAVAAGRRPAHRRHRPAQPARHPPPGRPLGRPRRRRGGAGRHRRPRRAHPPAQRPRLVPSRPLRHAVARPQDPARQLRRAPPPRASPPST